MQVQDLSKTLFRLLDELTSDKEQLDPVKFGELQKKPFVKFEYVRSNPVMRSTMALRLLFFSSFSRKRTELAGFSLDIRMISEILEMLHFLTDQREDFMMANVV